MTLVTHDSLVRAGITIFHREGRTITPENIHAFINGRKWDISLEDIYAIWDASMKQAYEDIKIREELLDRISKEK